MTRPKEQALEGRAILLYVGFVLVLLMSVLAYASMKENVQTDTVSLSPSIHTTVAEKDSEDFDDEDETASRSMIG